MVNYVHPSNFLHVINPLTNSISILSIDTILKDKVECEIPSYYYDEAKEFRIHPIKIRKITAAKTTKIFPFIQIFTKHNSIIVSKSINLYNGIFLHAKPLEKIPLVDLIENKTSTMRLDMNFVLDAGELNPEPQISQSVYLKYVFFNIGDTAYEIETEKPNFILNNIIVAF